MTKNKVGLVKCCSILNTAEFFNSLGHLRTCSRVHVNAPPHDGISLKAPWLEEAISRLKRLEESQSATNPYSPAYLFFTNHPYHYVGNDDVEPSQTAIFTAINIPDFKQETLDPTEVQTRSTEYLVARPTIDQLVDSVFNHARVPTRF